MASSDETFFTDPVICYFLDSILVVYCIVATALFFREKFSRMSSAAVGEPEGNECIYQELQKLKDAETYQVIKPSKGKKKAAKKKKTGSVPAVERDPEPFESLMPSAPAPRSPH